MAHPADKDGQPARSNPALQTLTLALLGTLVILLISPVSRPYLLCGLTGAEARVWHSTPLRPQNLSFLPQPDSLEDAALIMEVMAARLDTEDQKPTREELVTALEIAQAAAEQDPDNGYWWAAQATIQSGLGQIKESTESLVMERQCRIFRNYSQNRAGLLSSLLAKASGRQMLRHSLLIRDDSPTDIPSWLDPIKAPEQSIEGELNRDRFFEAIPSAAFLVCVTSLSLLGFLQFGLRYPRVSFFSLFGTLLGVLLYGIYSAYDSGDLPKIIETSLLLVIGAYLIAGFRMSDSSFRRTATIAFTILTAICFTVVLFRLSATDGISDSGPHLGILLKYLFVAGLLPLNQIIVGGGNTIRLFQRHLLIVIIVMSVTAVGTTLGLLSTEPQRLQLAADLLSLGTR